MPNYNQIMEAGSTKVFLVACEHSCFSPILWPHDRQPVDLFARTANFSTENRLAKTPLLLCGVWLLLLRTDTTTFLSKKCRSPSSSNSHSHSNSNSNLLSNCAQFVTSIEQGLKKNSASPGEMRIDCEQSLFYSKIREEEHKNWQNEHNILARLLTPALLDFSHNKIFLNKSKTHFKEHKFKQTQKHTIHMPSPFFFYCFYLIERKFIFLIYLNLFVP